MMCMKKELEEIGLTNLKEIYADLTPAQLVEKAILRKEGILTPAGAVSVKTGKYTGRSPEDRFIVDTPGIHNNIQWGNVNMPISPEKYYNLLHRLEAYLQGKDAFVFHGFVGADANYRINMRVINEYAWQNLFVHQLLVRPTAEELAVYQNDYTLICAPGFKAIPELDGTNSEAFVILNLEEKKIIIGGSSYAGEMKKSCFSLMNYLQPENDVFPMHCSANVDFANGSSALFFGLSGTGKTTLSADPDRMLIGDDEHGWSPDGIFNFEGGCYAKCINLTLENEPQIWNAIRYGAVLENAKIDEDTRVIDFDDASITENSRVGYPVEYIPNAAIGGKGGHPKTIIFLTADAFGVMPPISKLDMNQACYHFLSGYTSKLAGTERGITTPVPNFSAGFGGPFLPRSVAVYANMLKKRLTEHQVNVFLVNTGWTGGVYGVGSRIKLKYTRAMVSAALHGDLDHVEFRPHPIFGISMPVSCPNVPSEMLDPKNTWADKKAYDDTAKSLAEKFNKNFAEFPEVAAEIVAAGPNPNGK